MFSFTSGIAPSLFSLTCWSLLSCWDGFSSVNSLRSAEDAGKKYLAFPGGLLSGLGEPQLKMKSVAYGFFSLMSQSNGQHRHAELLELCVSNTRHAKICLSSFLGDAHLRIIMYILLKMPFFFFLSDWIMGHFLCTSQEGTWRDSWAQWSWGVPSDSAYSVILRTCKTYGKIF